MARGHCFLSMASERASVTVLTQALALFFLSSFFLMFLIGVLFLLLLENCGKDVTLTPGYSPIFQCFFLDGAVVEEETRNRRSGRAAVVLVLAGSVEGRKEEESER